MYPDLSYLFHDLFGTSYDNGFSIVKMYGLMLALAFLCALIVFKSELERHAHLKNFKPQNIKIDNSSPKKRISLALAYLYAFILGYKLGYVLLNWSSFVNDSHGVLFSYSGYVWSGLLAIAFSFFMEKLSAAKEKGIDTLSLYPHDYVVQITLIAAIFGVLGAKVLSIIEEPARFIAAPLETLLSGSGLTIYGGIIGGFIACTIFLRIKKIPLLRVWDSAAPALFIGYAVGRLGCHLAGDGDWGKPHSAPIPDWFIFPDWLWSYHYPHNIINRGVAMSDCTAKYCKELSPSVYPTSLYEIIMILALFAVLWSIRKKIKIPGLIFSIYLILNGVERFFIEFVRINKQYDILGFQLSQAQYIAICLMFIGIVLSYSFIVIGTKSKS